MHLILVEAEVLIKAEALQRGIEISKLLEDRVNLNKKSTSDFVELCKNRSLNCIVFGNFDNADEYKIKNSLGVSEINLLHLSSNELNSYRDKSKKIIDLMKRKVFVRSYVFSRTKMFSPDILQSVRVVDGDQGLVLS